MAGPGAQDEDQWLYLRSTYPLFIVLYVVPIRLSPYEHVTIMELNL